MERQNWYFTFGSNHELGLYKYVKSFGTFDEARRHIYDIFENKWAFQYSEKEFEGVAEKYHMTEHKL